METLMAKVNWGLSAVTVGHSYSSWCHSCLEVAMPPLTHSLPSLCVPFLVLNASLFLIPVNQEAETMTRSHGTYNFERAMSSNAIPLVSPMAFIVVLQTQDWFFQSLWRHYRFKPIHCLLTTTTTLLCPFLGSEDTSAGLLSLWPLPSIPPFAQFIHSIPNSLSSMLSK